MSESLYNGKTDESENQESDSLPPAASNGDINLWIDEDKNGNVFFRIDAPFLESEPVFLNDDLKRGMNQMVENWREQRSGGGS